MKGWNKYEKIAVVVPGLIGAMFLAIAYPPDTKIVAQVFGPLLISISISLTVLIWELKQSKKD